MGGTCCASRDKKASLSAGAGAKAAPKSRPKYSVTNMGPMSGHKRALSIGASATAADAAAFDQAIIEMDVDRESPDFSQAKYESALRTFVGLVPSKEAIEPLEEPVHYWAAMPATVGALTCFQLAVAVEECPDSRVFLVSAGAVSKLVACLGSEEEGRVEGASIALGCLTEDCPEAARRLFEEGGMPLLIKLMSSPKGGLRTAAASSVRNMCMEGEDHRQKFLQLGGLKASVAQLSYPPDSTCNHEELLVEMMLNLIDLLEETGPAGDAALNPGLAKEAVQLGAIEMLKGIPIKANSTPELADTVDLTLGSLTPYQ